MKKNLTEKFAMTKLTMETGEAMRFVNFHRCGTFREKDKMESLVIGNCLEF